MARFITRITIDGPDGNIFAIIGNVRRVAREIGVPESEIEEFTRRIKNADSYHAALAVVREWFETTGEDA